MLAIAGAVNSRRIAAESWLLVVKHASLSFPVKEGRRTSDPTNPNRFGFSGLAPLQEVMKFQLDHIPWANPRHPNPKSKLARVIKDSAFNSRGRFHLLNRGITLLADEGKLEHDVLQIDFGPSKKRGLVDGGTTVGSLVEAINSGFTQNPIKEEMQYVRVQVFCGPWTDEEVVELAEALNTSVQVDSFSIANLDNKFDWIKQTLKGAGFKVSYFANDEGEVSIDDIVQWLGLFMMDEPSAAYSSKERCLKHYLDNLPNYMKFGSLLLDVIKLSEYVPTRIKPLYNDTGGKFAKLSIIADCTKGSSYSLPVSGETIDYAPHKAWVFPLMASLRSVLDTSASPFKWKTNPFKLFDQFAPELLNKINRSYKHIENFNAVGKNPDLYETLADKVRAAIK